MNMWIGLKILAYLLRVYCSRSTWVNWKGPCSLLMVQGSLLSPCTIW